MAPEDDDDLYDEEFDFVDEEDESPVDDTDIADEAPQDDQRSEGSSDAETDESVDEYGRPEPAANYVVHVYEHRKFKRTIDRPFTPEDAEAFASEYNRTSKSYGRFAQAGKNDAKPKKTLDKSTDKSTDEE
jgi:hypothetical protein